MMTCTAEICAILPYLAAGAYIAIMLAVLGVPQLITYYLDRRNQRRDRKEDQAESERNRNETKSEAERIRQERQAENERNRADAERRHQEMIALLAGLVTPLTAMTANLVENRQPPPPAPDQSEAIANLQRAVTELTAAFKEMREQIQNGNGRSGAKADD